MELMKTEHGKSIDVADHYCEICHKSINPAHFDDGRCIKHRTMDFETFNQRLVIISNPTTYAGPINNLADLVASLQDTTNILVTRTLTRRSVRTETFRF